MTHQLKVEKMIACPVDDVFRAIQAGRLFMNCGFDSRSMELDFRVGGAYKVELKKMKKINFGEFLEIIPNRKVVFSWCQTFAPDAKPDTQVIIELFADGPTTRLVLEHKGFRDKDVCDAHHNGWTSIVTDFANEVQAGTLRMVRAFDVPVEKLFATVLNPETFFGFMGDVSKGIVDMKVGGKYQVPTKTGEVRGDFLEIVPNKTISFSWLSGCSVPFDNSRVTLNFKPKAEGSMIELLHTGLVSEKEYIAHRQGWDFVTENIGKALS